MNNRIYITLAIFLLFHFFAISQQQLQRNVFIKGTFQKPPDSARIILSAYDRNFQTISTTIKDGSFMFVINLDAPTMAYISIEGNSKQNDGKKNEVGYNKGKFSSSRDVLMLFVEPGTMIIKTT